MGEAKIRLESVRAEFLMLVEAWIEPPTPDELKLVSEVSLLPVYCVELAPRDQLEWMRMKPRECHQNCHFYSNNDPSKKSKVIAGWLFDGKGTYVLHSVISNDGDLLCVTPSEPRHDSISFVPDDKIICEIGEDGKYHHSRDGIKIEYGLRKNPEKNIAEARIIKQRLLSGMNPYQATKGPF